jgi:hypothetical protein
MQGVIMNGRMAFTIAAIGAGIYVLYKNACRRAAQQREHQQAKADWENEGGATASPPAQPA